MSHTYRNFSSEFDAHRDPRTAAMLSLIPGLGQYYNGQSRKGLLFLDVAILNYILLGLILLAPQISEGLKKLGEAFNMEINQTLVSLLHSSRLGTPASLVIIGLALTFIAYAVRDAYDQANLKRRKAIYKDSILELNEAASGSYILHASSIVGLAVMALFFFVPHPTARQVIEIEILSNIAKSTPKQLTQNIAKVPSAPQKKFDPSRELNPTARQAQLSKTASISKTQPASTSSSSPASKSSSVTAPKPSMQNMIARAFTPPAPPTPVTRSVQTATLTPPLQAVKLPTSATSTASAVMTPMPKPILAKAVSNFAPQPPMPVAPSTAAAAPKLPVPVSITPNNFTPATLSSALPATQSALQAHSGTQMAGSSILKNANSGAPMPSTTASKASGAYALPGMQLGNPGGMSSASGKAVAPLNPGTLGGRSGSSATTAPMLDAGEFSSNSKGAGRSTQPVTMPMEGNGRGNSRGIGEKGNVPTPVRASGRDRGSVPDLVPQVGTGTARPNTKEGQDGPVAIAPARQVDVDFTGFMDRLQRKIKRAWIPPRDGSSRKVRVMFKIFTNGELGRVQLVQGSGIAVADQAALRAVENAAPFEHLPAGAPESIDVEFTFDYNVFQGSLR